MAISIDSVYQRVLALANKEQRGYITPLEFNLFANQSQLAIFEQYFYDLNQFKRVANDESTISDIPDNIRDKLADFIVYRNATGGDIRNTFGVEPYAIGKILVHQGSYERVVEAKRISGLEIENILSSQFHMKGLQKNPVYTERPESATGTSFIRVYNHNGLINTGGAPSGVTAEVVVRPEKVEWGYDVIAEKALYNASRSTNFQLHQSEESLLVIKILELAGITLNKPGLVQIADQEDIKKIQQEKQ